MIGNRPLASAIERSIHAALTSTFVHLVDGGSAWDVFRRSLDAAIRDIEKHPRGILFRRLIEYGPRDSDDTATSTDGQRSTLTRAECEVCVKFIKFHMINRFKGELAELLALGPCIDLVHQLCLERRLPSNVELYWGEIIQERFYKKSARDGPSLQWGTFTKGADGLLVEHLSNPPDKPAPYLKIHGVVEIKSMMSYPKKILVQINKHLLRLCGGLKLGDTIWSADDLYQPIDRPSLCRIIVVPSNWKLNREWERIEVENGPDQLVTKQTQPPVQTRTEEVKHNLWKITLEWSHEALEEAAYEMTFWYMSQVGKFVYERKEIPKSWEEMTVERVGYNAIKEMLYHIILHRLSPRQDQIAIRLYNVYSFGYPLGVDSKEMLWPADFSDRHGAGTSVMGKQRADSK
jgi:hypothetical protein